MLHKFFATVSLLVPLATAGGTDPPVSPPGEGTLPVRPLSVPLSVPLEAYGENALSGGPRRDGIPSIDEPRFISPDEADDYLQPGDVVFGINMEGEAKAYPQRILVWHEIVNDSFGEQNVSVAYCPLTGTALAFERGTTTLGVSGKLVNNNLIMYDRSTGSEWPQILSTAITGPLKEKSLKELPVVWTTWSRWKALHPDTRVLSTDTGYARKYFDDPYGAYNPRRAYYSPEAPPLFPVMQDDSRLPPKEVVLGARTSAGAAAFHHQSLSREKLMHGNLGGEPVVAVYDERLETGYVYRTPDLKPAYRGGKFIVGGETYAPDALPLERVNAFQAMWFAWYAFFPQTAFYE